MVKPHQFKLSTFLLFFTFVAAAFAIVTSSSSFVRTIAGAVIAANILGAIAALFITEGLGFPRDGTLRYKEDVGETNLDDLE